MKFTFALLVALAIVRPVAAQTFPIAVHEYPGCQFYVADATPIDPGVTCHPPALVSGQEHWGPANDMPCDETLGLLNPCIGHTHIECIKPLIWGESTGFLSLNCRVVIYHTLGYISQVWGELESAILWQDTGSSAAPFMLGDPMGVRAFNFTMAFDPRVGYAIGQWQCPHGWNAHGWACLAIQARTEFSHGGQADNLTALPFFSVLDPSAAEFRTGEDPLLRVQVSVQPPGEMNIWGAVIVQTSQRIPDPRLLTAPVYLDTLGGQAYGQQGNAPSYELSMRKNMNLHEGDIGTPLTTRWMLPTELNAGDRVAAIWRADSLGGSSDGLFRAHESIAALLVITPADAGGISPPPTCQDHNATNFGGPLPCVYPPPTNPWTTLFFQPSPPVWLGQCTTPNLPAPNTCFPLNMLAVCAGADPHNCAWTPVIVP